MRRLAIALLFVVTLSSCAIAQARKPYVRATGEATVAAKPDIAHISVSVVTQGTTANEASSANATQTAAVLASLRSLLGPNADIQTRGYSLNPNYRYPQGGGSPQLTGYSANNSIEVATTTLNLVGRIIDTAVQAGATNIGGIRFGLQDELPLRQQALRQAASRARQQAQAIAAGLGASTGAVLAAEEGSTIRPIVADARLMSAAPPTTPVESGDVLVTATVTVDLELVGV